MKKINQMFFPSLVIRTGFISLSLLALTGCPSTSNTNSNPNSNTGSSTTQSATKVNPPTALSYGANTFQFTIGTAISTLTPSVTGGLGTFSGTVPAGLQLDPSTGNITGTPSKVIANTQYTITVTNSAGSVAVNPSIQVLDMIPSALSYGSTSFVFADSQTITPILPVNQGGTDLQYSAVNVSTGAVGLASGLSLDSTSGKISGFPAVIAPTNYKITAQNSLGSTSVTIQITVLGIPFSVVALPPSSANSFTVALGSCSPLAIGLSDFAGNFVATPNAVTLSLSLSNQFGSPPSVQLFSDAQCTVPATSLAFNAGASSATVYVGTLDAGSQTLSLSGQLSPSSAVSSLSISVNVSSTPNYLSFSTGDLSYSSNGGKTYTRNTIGSISVGTCTPYTVVLQDAGGNAIQAPASAPLYIQGELIGNPALPTEFQVFTDSFCQNSAASINQPNQIQMSSIPFPSGKSSVSFSVMVASRALSSASFLVLNPFNPLDAIRGTYSWVLPGTANGDLGLRLLVNSTVSVCTPVWLESLDAFGNPSLLLSQAASWTLNSGASSGISFYSDSGCTVSTNQFSLPQGSDAGFLYMRGSSAGSFSASATNNSSSLVSNFPILEQNLTAPLSGTSPVAWYIVPPLAYANSCVPVQAVNVVNNSTIQNSQNGVSLNPYDYGLFANPTFLYSDANCTQSLLSNAISIPAGGNSTVFYIQVQAGAGTLLSVPFQSAEFSYGPADQILVQ